MQTSFPSAVTRPEWRQRVALMLAPTFLGLLWIPEIKGPWRGLESDSSLSHGPLVPLVVLGLIFMQRDRLRNWAAADGRGLLAAVLASLLYIVAVWADVDFLKPLGLIGLTLSTIWFLGGIENLKA